MGRVILCTGQRAKIPYHFIEPGVNVFCIEELCYVLTQNAFLLGREVVSKELIVWIDKECGCPQLAQALYPYLNQKGSPEAFVSEILSYAGLYGNEIIAQTEKAIKMGENLSVYEKRKKRIDNMVEKGKYEAALSQYDRLLEELPDGERILSAKLLHNKGVALCRTFSFAQAAACFESSWELVPEEETCLHFLAAKRMELSDADYIAFAAQREEEYRITLELERRMEVLQKEYQEDETKQRLEQMKAYRNGEEAVKYYAGTDKIARRLKEDYRSHASQ